MIAKIENLYLRRLALVASVPVVIVILTIAAVLQFLAVAGIGVALAAFDVFEDLIEGRIELGEQYAASWARR